MALDALIAHPDSLSAARLAGYKNFFPCRACEGGVFVPDWGLTLRGISAGPEHSLLAVGPDAVDLSGKDLLFPYFFAPRRKNTYKSPACFYSSPPQYFEGPHLQEASLQSCSQDG